MIPDFKTLHRLSPFCSDKFTFYHDDMTWPQPASRVSMDVAELILMKKRGLEKEKTRKRECTERAVKQYGVGILLGLLAVHWTKKIIRKIPIVGRITGPVLGLLPTIVVGPALGAALTYGVVHGEGDVFAARHKVKEGLGQVSREVELRAKSLRESLEQEIPRLEARTEAGARKLAVVVKDTVGSMEREITPILERRSREAQRQLEQMKKEWKRA